MKGRLAVHFGASIKRLRSERGWSQVEFGERCGFYQTYLSRVETGKANPTLNAMEVIASALGLSIFDLFEDVRKETMQSATAKAIKRRPAN